MPINKAFGAILLGTGNALWPSGYIIIMAVWLYNIFVKAGKFGIVRGSIVNISEDQRLQLLLMAANTAGGSMAKLISPQSIAIAAAAVNQIGKESNIFKYTLKYSLELLLLVCFLTFVLSFMLA